jgi:hypothetical protein
LPSEAEMLVGWWSGGAVGRVVVMVVLCRRIHIGMGRHAIAGLVGASKIAQHDVMRGHVEQAKMAASNSRGADHCWGGSSPAVACDDNGPRQHGAWSMEHDDGQDESRSAGRAARLGLRNLCSSQQRAARPGLAQTVSRGTYLF